MWTGTAAATPTPGSRPVPPFAASGIDYLSNWLFVGEQMRATKKTHWGEFPPMGLF
jgi:hypothetical protein